MPSLSPSCPKHALAKSKPPPTATQRDLCFSTQTMTQKADLGPQTYPNEPERLETIPHSLVQVENGHRRLPALGPNLSGGW